MSGEYEPIRIGTKATFRFRCRWKAYGSMSWAAQLTGRSPEGRRVDWSFQTDARAKLARPDDGAASIASGRSSDGGRVDWSFQTDARAKLARPDDGAASVASCEPPDESRNRPGHDDQVRHAD